MIVAVDNAGEFSNDFLEFSQTANLRAMNINPQRAVVIQGRCRACHASCRCWVAQRAPVPPPCGVFSSGKHVQVLKIMIYQISWLKKNLLNPLEAEMWRVRQSRPSPPSVTYRRMSPAPARYTVQARSSYHSKERTCMDRLLSFVCFLLFAVACFLLVAVSIAFGTDDDDVRTASEQWSTLGENFSAQFQDHSLLLVFTAFLLAGETASHILYRLYARMPGLAFSPFRSSRLP